MTPRADATNLTDQRRPARTATGGRHGGAGADTADDFGLAPPDDVPKNVQEFIGRLRRQEDDHGA